MSSQRAPGKRLVGGYVSQGLGDAIDKWLERHPDKTQTDFVVEAILGKFEREGIKLDRAEAVRDSRARVPFSSAKVVGKENPNPSEAELSSRISRADQSARDEALSQESSPSLSTGGHAEKRQRPSGGKQARPEAMAALRKALPKGRLPLSNRGKRQAIRGLRTALGFKAWPKDITRHTAASYWLAMEPDAAKVAEMLGHSESVLKRNYKALVTQKHAAGFWKGV